MLLAFQRPEDPNELLGLYPERTDDTEFIRPRNLQLIPNRYAALLIHRENVMPKQAYQEIRGALAADDRLIQGEDIITWLRAACTLRMGPGDQLLAPLGPFLAINAVNPPDSVYEYLEKKVQVDLPGRGGVPPLGGEGGFGDGIGGTFATQLVGVLQTLATAGNRAPTVGGRDSDERKTLREAYKETHGVLLRFCNVHDTVQIARLWRRLANSHKQEVHTVLTQEFQRVRTEHGLATDIYSPVVSTAIKQMVSGLQFVGLGTEDLESGCQPYLVWYSGYKANHTAQLAAELSNQLEQGDYSATLTDYRCLKASEKVLFPHDAHEVGITLHRYAVLIQALFQGEGVAHPFVQSIWDLATTFTQEIPYISYTTLPGWKPSALHPSHILPSCTTGDTIGSTGIPTSRIHNITQDSASVMLPSFTQLLRDLQRGTYQNSNNWAPLLERYYQELMESALGAPNTVRNRSVQPFIYGQQSDRCRVPNSAPCTNLTRAPKPHPDAEFKSIRLRTGLRDFLRNTPPPMSNTGHPPFFVSW